MSLRTKLLLVTFLFMVIVVGLLTLNLSLEAAVNRARARDRDARLLERLAADWIRESAGARGFVDWTEVAQRLGRSTLIDNWVIVERTASGLEPRTHGGVSFTPTLDERDLKRLGEAIDERKTSSTSTRVYLPIEAAGGVVYGARFDLKPELVPESDFRETLRSIVSIMALGTLLILLNSYIFLNRFVLRPLRNLVNVSERVAEGDFSTKVPERGSFDEMGSLERAFNLMIDKIGSSHQNLREKIHKTERRLVHAQRLSSTGTLAAGIAHEINNPLGGMLNAARTLESGKLDDAKRAEYLGLIVEGLERIRAIVQRILQFRPKEVESRPVKLREVADRAIAFCEHRLRQKELEVRNEVPADLPWVNGDAVELQQALLNVLMNAIDACVIAEGRIVVRGAVEGESVRLSVADNGMGMDADELSRCMDVFFTTKDPGEGTGLGLSVVNSIIENHGGRLEIESKKGEGTIVHMVLPSAKGVPSA